MIKLLPDHVINKLKAGEIVERPMSVVKELIENALDAGATMIDIDIVDGGMTRISVLDNGSGIQRSDSDMVLARYATSKITDDADLQTLESYGFRGEALASISEVSRIALESKTTYSDIGLKISNETDTISTTRHAIARDHGTRVTVADLFYSVPVRRKYCKSTQTEYYYCYQIVTDYALIRPDIHWICRKNSTLVYDLPIVTSLYDRLLGLYKKDRGPHLIAHQLVHGDITIDAVVSDSSLSFGASDYCKIFVNTRPIQDRAIQRAIMEGYYRQLHQGQYPVALIHISLPSDQVDVNIHPRKLQVKFLESQRIFSLVSQTIQQALGENKIVSQMHTPHQTIPSRMNSNSSLEQTTSSTPVSQSFFTLNDLAQVYIPHEPSTAQTTISDQPDFHNITIIGQVRNMYILVQHETGLRYIDQHALAERIAFEKLKKDAQKSFVSGQISTLLYPVSVSLAANILIGDDDISQLEGLGFSVSLLGTSLVIYGIPQALHTYTLDIEQVIIYILSHRHADDSIDLSKLLDALFATKACKASIKAGDKLAIGQMQHLIQEGFEHIPGSFVCQHGRPFVIDITKKSIDVLFDR